MSPAQRAKRDAFLARIGTRPLIMGILNVTPDSFSDGGRFVAAEAAIAHAHKMVAQGCDIVDVGAESTRPGATPIEADDEFARLEPVLAALARLDAPLSVDTGKAAVAEQALAQGAVMINDVWGLQKDPALAGVIAQSEAAVVVMHNRTEKDDTLDIIADIRRSFDRSLTIATRAGIAKGRIVLDVGIGFGKTSRQNRDAIRRLGELMDYGLPIMVGASRKKFLGSLTGDGSEGTLAGTLAVSLAAVAAGASIVRVHDVAEHAAALKAFHTLRGD